MRWHLEKFLCLLFPRVSSPGTFFGSFVSLSASRIRNWLWLFLHSGGACIQCPAHTSFVRSIMACFHQWQRATNLYSLFIYLFLTGNLTALKSGRGTPSMSCTFPSCISMQNKCARFLYNSLEPCGKPLCSKNGPSSKNGPISFLLAGTCLSWGPQGLEPWWSFTLYVQ